MSVLKLSEEARGRILGLRRGMGYQDLLDIGEKLCQMEETELLKMDRSKGTTAEAILSKQDQCRGFRLFFEKLQFEIEGQVVALLESQEAAPKREPELVMDVQDAADVLGLMGEAEGSG